MIIKSKGGNGMFRIKSKLLNESSKTDVTPIFLV